MLRAGEFGFTSQRVGFRVKAVGVRVQHVRFGLQVIWLMEVGKCAGPGSRVYGLGSVNPPYSNSSLIWS